MAPLVACAAILDDALSERGDAVQYHGQIGRSQTHYTVDDYPLMRRVFFEDLWPILQEIVCFYALPLC